MSRRLIKKKQSAYGEALRNNTQRKHSLITLLRWLQTALNQDYSTRDRWFIPVLVAERFPHGDDRLCRSRRDTEKIFFFSDAEVFVAPSYFFQLRNHPTKRQTDEANAHELLLLVTAKNRGSTLWRSVFVWKRAINAWKGYFWNANRALMIQRWAQGKSFRCPAFIISFFFSLFLVWSLLGLFHACNFAGTECKARRFNAGETCFLRGGTRLHGNVFSQVWSVQVYSICSPLEHTSAHSARTWRIHTLTQCTTPKLLSTSSGRERERKKKSITVVIDFAAGWADLEPPCCSSNSRRIWEDVGVLLYTPIHSNPPRPTYKSHLRPVIQKK